MEMFENSRKKYYPSERHGLFQIKMRSAESSTYLDLMNILQEKLKKNKPD